MLPFLGEIYGNPSSVHHVGRRARALLDDARERAAGILRAKPSEVVFTSGGTESNNLAIFGVARLLKSRGRHLITSAIEHHAVLHCFDYLARKEGFEVTRLPVSPEGIVSPEDLRNALRPDTCSFPSWPPTTRSARSNWSLNWGRSARNEASSSTPMPCNGLARRRFAGVDQFNADLVSICGHKFHGPKGSRSAFHQSLCCLTPSRLAAATRTNAGRALENLAGILGFVAAPWTICTPTGVRARQTLNLFASDC